MNLYTAKREARKVKRARDLKSGSFKLIPSNLKIRTPYVATGEDFSDAVPLEYSLEKGNCKLRLPCGDLTSNDQNKRFEHLTQYKHIFHFSAPNRIYTILNGASDIELQRLAMLGEAEIADYNVKMYSSSIIISKNGNKTQITNIAPLLKDRIDDNIDSISESIKELQNFREMLSYPTTLISPAANASSCALLQEEILSGIRAMNKAPYSMLDKYLQACIGGVMESSGIGSRDMVGYDMKACHLNILKDFPNTADAIFIPGARYDKSQLATSIYQVKWNIPDNIEERLGYWSRPIPFHTEFGITKPTGIFIGWYYKDYLDLVEMLNRDYNAGIEYKVLDSITFMSNSPSYLFEPYMKELESMIKIANKLYPNIETKHFYNTISGSSKSIRRKVDRDLNEVQNTSILFAPQIYGFTLARQNCLNYIRGIKHNALALKIDATEETKRSEEEGFYRFKGEGSGFFLNPYLKSTESNKRKLWKEATLNSVGLPYVVIIEEYYVGLSQLTSDDFKNIKLGGELGRKYSARKFIKPKYGGNREGETIEDVRVLLEEWFPSKYGKGQPEKISHNLMNLPSRKELYQ